MPHWSLDESKRREVGLKISRRLTGKRFSPERCANMSRTVSGENHPNWGKSLSPQTRARISAAKMGKANTFLTGKPLTNAAKEKLRQSAIKRWENRDPETKLALLAGLADARVHANTAEINQRQSEMRRGRPLPPGFVTAGDTARKRRWDDPAEHARMGAIMRQLWENPEYKRRSMAALLKANRSRPNGLERRVIAFLDAYRPGEWKYCGNGDFIVGGKNPDFVNVNGQKSVIEVFGDYWHSERVTGKPPDQEVADRIAHFAQYGLRCIIIWEGEITDAGSVLARIDDTDNTSKASRVPEKETA